MAEPESVRCKTCKKTIPYDEIDNATGKCETCSIQQKVEDDMVPCKNCDKLLKITDMGEHMIFECPEGSDICGSCAKEVKKKDLEEHKKICNADPSDLYESHRSNIYGDVDERQRRPQMRMPSAETTVRNDEIYQKDDEPIEQYSVECRICKAPIPRDNIKEHEYKCQREHSVPVPYTVAEHDETRMRRRTVSPDFEDQYRYSPRQTGGQCKICGDVFPLQFLFQHESECSGRFRDPNAYEYENVRQKHWEDDMHFSNTTHFCRYCGGAYPATHLSEHEARCQSRLRMERLQLRDRNVSPYPREVDELPCRWCGHFFSSEHIDYHEARCEVRNERVRRSVGSPPLTASQPYPEDYKAPGLPYVNRSREDVGACRHCGTEMLQKYLPEHQVNCTSPKRMSPQMPPSYQDSNVLRSRPDASHYLPDVSQFPADLSRYQAGVSHSPPYVSDYGWSVPQPEKDYEISMRKQLYPDPLLVQRSQVQEDRIPCEICEGLVLPEEYMKHAEFCKKNQELKNDSHKFIDVRSKSPKETTVLENKIPCQFCERLLPVDEVMSHMESCRKEQQRKSAEKLKPQIQPSHSHSFIPKTKALEPEHPVPARRKLPATPTKVPVVNTERHTSKEAATQQQHTKLYTDEDKQKLVQQYFTTNQDSASKSKPLSAKSNTKSSPSKRHEEDDTKDLYEKISKEAEFESDSISVKDRVKQFEDL